MSQHLLTIVEMDHCGRQILADLQGPEGAAERLNQTVLGAKMSPAPLHQGHIAGFLRRMVQLLEFDVVGAGQTGSPIKEKKKGKKKKTGTRPKRER